MDGIVDSWLHAEEWTVTLLRYCLRLTAPGSLDLTSFGSLLLLLFGVVRCSYVPQQFAVLIGLMVGVSVGDDGGRGHGVAGCAVGAEEEEARHALVRQCGLSVARRTFCG